LLGPQQLPLLHAALTGVSVSSPERIGHGASVLSKSSTPSGAIGAAGAFKTVGTLFLRASGEVSAGGQ